jgi:hypothetical protein
MVKRIILLLLVILVVIQFFRPQKNLSITPSKVDIATQYAVPDNVTEILKHSCYDCHSNNTVYPWYFAIQPVAWWMQNHVNDGKRKLDFSEFASYTPKKQFHKMNDIIEQIKKDEMPLDSYLWIHRYAKLSEDQKNSILKWADSLGISIKVKNNLPDEPQRKRD